jgi:hypothetical protein
MLVISMMIITLLTSSHTPTHDSINHTGVHLMLSRHHEIMVPPTICQQDTLNHQRLHCDFGTMETSPTDTLIANIIVSCTWSCGCAV